MLEYIHIKNFQAHIDTKINFTEKSNSIIGPNDVGKSAIRRAFLWVAFNTPSGDSFRNWNGEETSVEIGWNRHIIKRIKGNKKNEYVLDDKKPFTGFGTKVPQPIAEVLNIHRDINILGQHDGAFLIGEKPTAVAKFINELADLSSIDSMLKFISMESNKLKQKLKFNNERKEELSEALKGFDDLDDTIILLEEAETIYKRIGKAEEKIEQVISLKGKIGTYKKKIKQYKKTLKCYGDLDEVILGLEKLMKSEDTLEELEMMVQDILDTKEIIEELVVNEDMAKLLSSAINELDVLMRGEEKIFELSEDTQQVSEQLKQVEKMKGYYKKLKKEFTENMPEVCPLCEQEVSK